MTSVLLIGILISCSSDGDGDTNSPTIPVPTQDPGGNSGNPTTVPPSDFSLSFPNNSEICQEGAAVANDPQSLRINFKWAASLNASGYELQIIDAESGNVVSKTQTSLTNLDVQVSKGTLYKWKVIASNDEGEVSSAEWGFYSKGESIGNFVPYPAYDIQLTFDQSSDELNVQWLATDEDEDILTYDIKVHKDGEEIISETDFEINSITNIPAVLGASYFVMITVKDEISATTTTSTTVIYE